MFFEKNIDFASDEIQGERQRQEDFCAFALLDETKSLYKGLVAILADGMGGHQAGDEASKIAVNASCNYFLQSQFDLAKSLEYSVRYANEQIGAFSINNAKDGCGSTIIYAYINEDKTSLYWVSVGDSLLYLYRAGKIQRLNADHSLYPELKLQLEQGLITEQELLENSHILRSALDGNRLELIDLSTSGYALESGDVIILASDGIETIEENEIEDFIQERDLLSAKGIADGLINLVEEKKKFGQDNTSVMVVKI
ncbi:MAG: protein phosphatase 2C domain-containing protein [Opitutales bacterium]